ncbi:MAG: acetyl-CoA carboxylase biotin carboxylase subunit [Chloroflexota bacterium]|nr:acetyl-CoA carboxylase biotin carboxylase subunit [Dehalococcoidia bacterium]MDW8254033.1 acetyl-CoA carboxylase biotin carboxylase subunit [Chloroflexota bacterium]
MFRKLFIANRGEIAVRIIRACRDLGIRSVVGYSEADRDSLAVQLADESICIGPGPSAKSYLNIPNIITAALLTNCDAVHPGYGFLSENPYLPEICEHCGLVFVGPPAEAIREMGDKARARARMAAVGVPTVPGTDRPLRNVAEARDRAAAIGYPVILKAALGGGGRGMRVARDEAELIHCYPLAEAEAETAFGRADLYLEKYLESPRHVEVQVLADRFGTTIALGTRDCSTQRRYQKIIEEAPAPALPPETLRAMADDAVRGAAAIGYVNAGTVEFLVDREGRYYFIEMNTRLQVEHPVTEELTGVDLVREQLRIAAGERIAPLASEADGHVIECRVTAEDPERDFRPVVGTVTAYRPPGGPGIRVDSHLMAGYTIPPYYDSLLAKIIARGRTRDEAIARLDRALAETVIEGVVTTVPFLRRVLASPAFRNRHLHTEVVQSILAEAR